MQSRLQRCARVNTSVTPYLFEPTQEPLLSPSVRQTGIKVKKYGCSRTLSALVMIIVIPLMIVATLVNFTSLLLVTLNGATTTGQYISRGVGAKGSHHVTYSYSVDGIEYRETASVSYEMYYRAPELPKLEVYYARLYPQISYLEPVTALQICLPGALMVFFIFGLISGLKLWLSRRRGRPAEHQLIPGILLGVNPIKTRGGVLWEIHYEFRSPRTHTIIQGQSTSIRRILSNRVIPPNGTELAIIYIDDAVHDPL